MSTVTRLRALACCLIFALLAGGANRAYAHEAAPATAAQAGEPEYRAALDAARGLTREQSWKKAQGAWLELLAAHAGAPYASADVEEIRLQLRRASFWAATRAPKLDDLLSGDLLSYEPSTGWLKIRYTRASLGDFAQEQAQQGIFAHPAHFKGPWTAGLAGTADEVLAATCLVSDRDAGFGVRFGAYEQGAPVYVDHVLFAYDQDGNKEVARSTPKQRKSKAPVEAEVGGVAQ
jgi:hypothetical protein